jgi:signal transduction histidine kinase
MCALHSPNFLILIVDDIATNVQVVGRILTDAGYSITFATDGRKALERVQQAKPDLILLDIMMPGLSGYEVCYQLKDNPATAEIPIIFLSALENELNQVRAFQVGGVDYITKPFQAEVVLARVENQLKIQDLQQQLKVRNRELQANNQKLRQEVEERKQAEALALRSSQAKSDFLNRMSHELRTPLNTILGYTEFVLLNPGQSIQQNKAYLEVIRRSGQYLLNMIDNILDMGKLEVDRIPLHTSLVNLPELLQELKLMFQLSAQDKSINLVWHCDPNLPRQIEIDEVKLRQIFINLFSNAVKFTEQGTIKVHAKPGGAKQISPEPISPEPISPEPISPEPIGTKQLGRKSRTPPPTSSAPNTNNTITLKFSVEDTGMGIAPEELERVFQPFEQTQSGRSLKKGTGLGMAISHQLVKLLGGEMTLTSTLGQGTCFNFTIQAQAPTKPANPMSLSPEGKISCQLPDLSASRILVVDETAVNRELFVKILTNAGYQVQGARNGQEAIEVWQSWHPHLILMDLYMPVMNGYQAIQWIRSQEAIQATDANKIQQQGLAPPEPLAIPTKIITLTASINPEDHLKAQAAGCDDIFLKPFKLKQLLSKVAEHLNLASQG